MVTLGQNESGMVATDLDPFRSRRYQMPASLPHLVLGASIFGLVDRHIVICKMVSYLTLYDLQ